MDNYYINTTYGKINIVEGINTNNIKAIMLWVHGFGGHCQYVDDTLDELVNKDFFYSKFSLKTIGFEFIGHGKSDGEKFYIEDINILVNILDIIIMHIKNKYNNIKIIICAESMGCTIVLKYLLNYKQDDIYPLIFLSPMCGIEKSNLPNPIITNMLICLSYFLPTFQTPCLDINDNITDNEEYNIKRSNSIYSFNNIYKLSTSHELYKLNEWVQNNIDKIEKLQNNFLIFHGKLDNICSHTMTFNVFKNVKNKEIILFQNKKHILLVQNNQNDIIPNIIYNKILEFINCNL